ncbi:squalene/phytoene synthase family protein [Tsukamurella sp. 8F]|uniref:phytoene/squalene synthase family protein n=1 Tax=unclassified Tsukamurella TaxID=2633480 RepID=UPI0023B95322|nr:MULTISPECIES: squalene/phytoene synthase family protein [unclassified Tsukamurella]MDF0528524.1 squalene/phytoene synthase family protein [Tsukamurella sp. 8J]MDF0586350.1 squalene/phytoene synthase family protein [Tsukamurella sp. 8F]
MDEAARERYTAAAHASAAVVIARYSSSFTLASRLMPRRVRRDMASVYGLVRVADEVVDGAGSAPAAQLAALEREVEAALGYGFSTNLVVHAFADTAHRTGFGTELTRPFFASMRADLVAASHSAASLADYIHGSAEVVGLMCLRIYLAPSAASRYDELAPGARALGSAFQKINFLRDLAYDAGRLGRSYFPDTDAETMTAEQFDVFVSDAEADLAAGRASIAGLPRDVRRGVYVAADVYGELLTRLRAAGLAGVRAERVRIPAWRKLGLAARTAAMPR